MKEFQDRVAVVTGGASASAAPWHCAFAREGMKIVLTMSRRCPEETEVTSKMQGFRYWPVRADVAKAKDVEALADKHSDLRGRAILWQQRWRRARRQGMGQTRRTGMDAWGQCMGVIHGIRAFVRACSAERGLPRVNTAR